VKRWEGVPSLLGGFVAILAVVGWWAYPALSLTFNGVPGANQVLGGTVNAWNAVPFEITSGGVGTSSFLVHQNFEGTGYDNSETWIATTGTGGSIDPDEATTVLRGSQSLRIYAGDSGQTSVTRINLGTTQNELWGFARVRIGSTLPGADTFFLRLYNVANDYNSGQINIRATGNGKIANGLTEATAVGIWSPNVTYYMWFYWTKGTGSDGLARLYIGTSSTRPASPITTLTAGNASFSPDSVQLRSLNQATLYFDQVQISTSEITNVAD
jgi:hypothetical protein